MKKLLTTTLLVLAFSAFIQGSASAYLQNGSFETGDLTGWNYFYGSVEVVTSATAYDGTQYNPTHGSYMAKLTPVFGDNSPGSAYFVDLYVNQYIPPLNTGDRLIFDWAFLGMDEAEYQGEDILDIDWAEMAYPSNHVLADTGHESAYGSDYTDTGWQTFEYILHSDEYPYLIEFRSSGLDEINSVLLVDNVRILTPAVPLPAAVWLLGSGLVGLVGLRRKMKR